MLPNLAIFAQKITVFIIFVTDESVETSVNEGIGYYPILTEVMVKEPPTALSLKI